MVTVSFGGAVTWNGAPSSAWATATVNTTEVSVAASTATPSASARFESAAIVGPVRASISAAVSPKLSVSFCGTLIFSEPL